MRHEINPDAKVTPQWVDFASVHAGAELFVRLRDKGVELEMIGCEDMTCRRYDFFASQGGDVRHVQVYHTGDGRQVVYGASAWGE